MRALSKTQASRCETARCKGCKCRCGGLLHGVRRFLPDHLRESTSQEALIDAAALMPEPEWFEALPEDDPHHVRSKEEKRARRRKPKPVSLQQPLWQETHGEA